MSPTTCCGAILEFPGLMRTDKYANRSPSAHLTAPIFCVRTIPPYRAHHTSVHEENLLRRNCTLVDAADPLPVMRPPKLILVSIDAEKTMLSLTNDDVKRHLRRSVEKLLQVLHPMGTIAFALPRPWDQHGGRIRGTALRTPRAHPFPVL